MDKARSIFEAAKAAYPAIYDGFPFETWVSYLANVGFVRIEAAGTEPSVLKITTLGQDFLHYLINHSLTSGKAG